MYDLKLGYGIALSYTPSLMPQSSTLHDQSMEKIYEHSKCRCIFRMADTSSVNFRAKRLNKKTSAMYGVRTYRLCIVEAAISAITINRNELYKACCHPQGTDNPGDMAAGAFTLGTHGSTRLNCGIIPIYRSVGRSLLWLQKTQRGQGTN